VYKLAVSGASDITLHLDQEATLLHRGDAIFRPRELLVGEVSIISEDWWNETLLPCEAFGDAGNLESTPCKHVLLVDEEEVGLDLVSGKLHLLGLEIALASLSKVGHKAVVVEVNGGVSEGLEGGGPSFNERLDPEG
jgi:hypothetical protein